MLPLITLMFGGSGRHPEEVVVVRLFHEYLHDIALLQAAHIAQVDLAVDSGRVGLGAAGGADVRFLSKPDVTQPPLSTLLGHVHCLLQLPTAAWWRRALPGSAVGLEAARDRDRILHA
jgi:hypothetical protein